MGCETEVGIECGMEVCSGTGPCVEIGGGADCCWNTEVSEFEAAGAVAGSDAACSGWVFA
jgi:hypothetical protein